MKYYLRSIVFGAVALTLLVNVASEIRADETNEARPTPPPPPRVERKVFFFEGGNPIDFILAMDKHFRTRLGQILSIPSSLARAHVPKMKIATDQPEDALKVYNYLDDPMLGQWKYTGPSDDPAVLALIPDKQVALTRTGARVKALPLSGIPVSKWKVLQEDVQAARDAGMGMADKLGGERYDGDIHIQRDSKILIASGSEGFIQMVESVLAAYRTNAQAEAQTSAASK